MDGVPGIRNDSHDYENFHFKREAHSSGLASLQFVQFIQNEADILDVIQQTVVVSFGTPIHLRALDIATEQLYDSNVLMGASAGNLSLIHISEPTRPY